MTKLYHLKFKGLSLRKREEVIGKLELVNMSANEFKPQMIIGINNGSETIPCASETIELFESNALMDVRKERSRQDAKWGEQNHNPIEWMAILTEEVGEAAKEAVDFHFALGDIDIKLNAGVRLQADRLQRYRTEMIQVAAVAVSAVESLDRAL